MSNYYFMADPGVSSTTIKGRITKFVGTLSLLITIALIPVLSNAATLQTDPSTGFVTSITDLEVNGLLYDATFHPGKSFNVLWNADNDGGFGPPFGEIPHKPMFWGSSESSIAAQAIIDALGNEHRTNPLGDNFEIPHFWCSVWQSSICGLMDTSGDIANDGLGTFLYQGYDWVPVGMPYVSFSPVTITLNPNEPHDDSVGYDEWDHFMIETTEGTTELVVILNNLSSDVDLYVSKDTIPTYDRFDCRPYEGGTEAEICRLPNPGKARWFISVHGYTAGSYTIEAKTDELIELTSGQLIHGAVEQDQWQYYVFHATDASSQLVIELLKVTGDPDLYVKKGSKPTLYSYDCRPYLEGPQGESCMEQIYEGESLYIGVHGYAPSNYWIKATLTDADVLVDGEVRTDYVEQDQWQYYVFHATDEGSELVIDLYDLSGDVDLYVQMGSKPTLSSYDCRPYTGGLQPELCKINTVSGGTVYIGVHGYNAGSFSVRATFGGETELVSNIVKSDFVAQGQWHYYRLKNLPFDPIAEATIDLFNLNGDVDLYVKNGARPTLTSFDCRPYVGGLQAESCSFRTVEGDNWYIGVYGYNGGDYSIVAKLTRITALTSGQAEQGFVNQGLWRHYMISAPSDVTQLIVEMSDLIADVDLYVRNGELSTLEKYDCRPYASGTTEEYCTMTNTGATTWYISVHGYESDTNGHFKIRATLY